MEVAILKSQDLYRRGEQDIMVAPPPCPQGDQGLDPGLVQESQVEGHLCGGNTRKKGLQRAVSSQSSSFP